MAPATGKSVTVTLHGAPQLKAQFAKLGEAVAGPKVKAALRAGALVIANDAKARAPVRTGTLRRSIGIEDGPGPYEVSIGTDLEYAPYVEFGTYKMAARPYLRPAFDENVGAARQEIADVLAQLLEDAI